MKHTEQYTETVTRERVVKITCDRCDAEIPKKSSYEVRNVKISIESGEVYPEGGITNVWGVEDICDDCLTVLRSVLEREGFNVYDKDRWY